MKIAIFYHCLFCLGDPSEPQPTGIAVVNEQMEVLRGSGLLEKADEFWVGINGSEESEVYADCIIPSKAVKVYHGTQCRNELRTIMLLQEVMAGRKGWAALYFHAKGFNHPLDDKLAHNWRWCGMYNLVQNWEICVESLSEGFESVGCHWKTGQCDGTQNIWAGNFWWSKSEFINTLPAIQNHPRISTMGGIDALASRFEAEVWLGSGRRLPRVLDFHPSGPFTCGN